MSWVQIQKFGAKSSSGASVTTAGVNTTGATLIDIETTWYNNVASPPPTLSDSYGNTWTQIAAVNNSTGLQLHTRWYCLNPTVGTGHTFTVSGGMTGGGGSNNSYPSIAVEAWSGNATSSPLDQVAYGQASSTTSQQAGSGIVPSASGCLILSSVGLGTGNTDASATIDSSLTVDEFEPGGSGTDFGSGIASFVQTSLAPINPKWSWTTACGGASIVVSYLPAGGGGGGGGGGGASWTGTGGSTYDLELDHLTTPNLPPASVVQAGAFATSSDGTNNRIQQTGTSTVSTLQLPATPAANGASSYTLALTAYFSNIPAPTTSYVYVGCQQQSDGHEYDVVLARGTSETRGALWVQKNAGGTVTPLGSPNFVGTSGSTFTQNQSYAVTVSVNGVGTGTISFSVKVQRVSDGFYLTSAGAWQSASATALSVSDGSSPYAWGNVSLNFDASTLDGYIYGLTVNVCDLFTRNGRTTPVLTKGGTYDGWTADALADPSVCYDGTRYVLAVNAWSVANNQWAQLFFSSPDGFTWTYLTGSIIQPSGSDYIFGNGGIAYWGSKYWLGYSHYPSGSSTSNVGVRYATSFANLVANTWTTVNDDLITGYTDASFSVNPTSSKLELWAVDYASHTDVCLVDTPDGSTWTNEGTTFTKPSFATYDFGEPAVFYVDNSGTYTRYLTFDFAPVAFGHRFTGIADYNGSSWVLEGYGLLTEPGDSWEAAEVFDGSPLVVDLGDGAGAVPRIWYAGSDTNSGTDNTDSSIGLATLSLVSQPTVSFSVSPTSITGGSATLTWSSSNAPDVSINQGIGSVGASGTHSVSPTSTTTYTITATSEVGSVSLSVTLTVTISSGLTQFFVQAELAGRGNGWTDITRDVVCDVAMKTKRSFQSNAPQDLVMQPPTWTFDLDNSVNNSAGLSWYYSPDSSNARAGWAMGIRLQLQIACNSHTYTKFLGFLSDIIPKPGKYDEQTVSVLVVGWLQMAATCGIAALDIAINQRGDQLMTQLVALVPDQPEATSFAPGLDIYPFSFDDLTVNQSTVMDGITSTTESGFDRVWEKGDGTLIYETRQTLQSYTSPVMTITDTAPSGYPGLALIEVPGKRQLGKVLNAFQVTVTPRYTDASPVVLYSLPISSSSQPITPNQTVTFICPFVDPNQTAQQVGGFNCLISDGMGGSTIGTTGSLPVADYAYYSSPLGVGTNESSGMTVTVSYAANQATISVTNNNPVTVYPNLLQCRGQGIYAYQQVIGFATNAASIAQCGQNTAQVQAPYQGNPAFATTAAQFCIVRYSSSATLLEEGISLFINASDQISLDTLFSTLDVSLPIVVQETVLGLNQGYWINGEDLTIDDRGNITIHYPLALNLSGVVWIAGVSTAGVTTVPGL